MKHSSSSRARNNRLPRIMVLLAAFVFLWQTVFLYPFAGTAEAIPVAVTADAPVTGFEVKKTIASTIAKSLGKALKQAAENAARTFATQVAYQAAITIAEGNYGEEIFRTDTWGKIVKDASDAATGDFLDTAFQEAVGGDTNFDICNPRLDLLLPIAIQVQEEIQPRAPRCTWSQIKENNANYFSDPNFLNNFGASLELEETDFGAYLELKEKQAEKEQEAKESAEGQLDLHPEIAEDPRSEKTTTPDSLKQEEIAQSTVRDPHELQQRANDPARCDSIWCSVSYVFTSTLQNRLSKRLFAGLVKKLGGNTITAKFIKDKIAEILGSDNSFGINIGVSTGSISARNAFIDLAKPNLAGSGAIDVVAQLSGQECPEDKDPDQCVITDSFGQAIRQKLTLNQALGRETFGFGQRAEFLSPDLIFGYSTVGGDGQELQEPDRDKGISYSTMVVLRKYRVIPVTWEIAAQYIAQNENRAYTLGEMVDLYDDPTSPFYHLVDPDWVLKAPDAQCVRTGYVDDVLDESCTEQAQDLNDLSAPLQKNDIPESLSCPNPAVEQSGGQEYDDVNQDGLCDPEKDKKITCNRKRACVDQQSCIIEDENGNCLDFGYCTEEESIWRFGATQCKPEYASCLHYVNVATGEESNFLRRSLALGDCASDNSLGCRAYCQAGTESFWECTYNSGAGLQSPDPVAKPVLYLNSKTKQCSSGAAGCQQFIRTTNGSNLLTNPDFAQFGGTVEDAGDDDFGFCDASSPLDLIGKACSAQDSSECGGGLCRGWKEEGSSVLRATLFDQSPALQIMAGTANEGVEQPVNVGTPLAERRFALTFRGYSPTTVCSGGDRNGLSCTQDEECQAGGGVCSASNHAGTCQAKVQIKAPSDGTVVLDQTIDYADLPANEFAFDFLADPLLTATELQVVFYRAPSCHYVIDTVKLQEVEVGQPATSYTVYGANRDLLTLNSSRRSCEPEAVGCQLYSPANGDTPVPGIIREGDQCDPANVGCRSFQEIPTRDNFESTYNKPVHASRTGKFCQNRAADPANYGKSCIQNSDCDVNPGDGLCLPALSLVPQTGASCAPQEVGCEQFTNLDTGNVAEAIQYYSKIRPCVKLETAICQSYFTWEGSSTTGFQLREHFLKQDSADVDADGQTTEPELSIGKAQDVNDLDGDGNRTEPLHDLDGDGVYDEICNEAVFQSGENPDCQQFFDENNNEFYAFFSETISCTNACHPLRNSTDNEIYMAAPAESVQCRAEANGCREYKGNSGNNQRVVLDHVFRLDGDNLGWSGSPAGSPILSAESITALSGIGSLNSGSSNTKIISPAIPADYLTKNRSYVASFWMKGTAQPGGLTVYLEDVSADRYVLADGDDTTPAVAVNLSADEWNRYDIGPVVLDKTDNEDVRLVIDAIDGGSAGIYVSNIKVIENDSVYLVKGSAKLCQGDENCQNYSTNDGDDYTLKTFTRLCQQEFLGCEALINTQNSHQANAEEGRAQAQVFSRPENVTPSTAQNVMTVPEDSLEYLINDPANYCLPADRGCKAVGVPNIGYDGSIRSYTTRYLIDDPDSYADIMCQPSQEYCSAYFGGGDGQTLEQFKNPGENVCEYRVVAATSAKKWFIRGTDIDCPTRFVNTFPERHTPTGQVCLQTGLCVPESGPPTSDRCLFNADCADGYHCTLINSVQPVEPIIPCSYAGDPVCGVNACGYWAGSCPADQNICTEFVDVQDRAAGDAESNYFYLNDDTINTVDCSEIGLDPQAGCVGFQDSSDTELTINSNQYCASDIQRAASAPSFYDELRTTGRVCRNAAVDCGNPNETCENLPTDSFQSPQSCLTCSSDLHSCNDGTNAPCCGRPGICAQPSGARTRVSCFDDSDCTAVDPSFTCQTQQIFCDANQVVKVARDRVCDKWLTCAESSTVTDSFGRKKNICLKREVCDAGSEGSCTARAVLPSGNMTPDADKDNSIQSRISNINTISHLSGYTLAGLKFDDDKIIQGYLPYSQMYEFGLDATEVEIPNPSFSRKQGGANKMPPDEWYPIVIDDQDSAQVQTIRETSSTRITNKYMRLNRLNSAQGGGAFVTITDPTTLGRDTEFWTISFRAKALNNTPSGQNALTVALRAADDAGVRAETNQDIVLKDYWDEYTFQLVNRGGILADHDVVYLEFLIPAKAPSQDFVDIDDVSIKPVLVVQNLPDENVTTYASSILADPNVSGSADPFTWIPGVDEAYDPIYGDASIPYNDNDDPTSVLGNSDQSISLGAVVPGKCDDPATCHGRLTVDFGAMILVDTAGKDDLKIQEWGAATFECYTVELAAQDQAFELVVPPSDDRKNNITGVDTPDGIPDQACAYDTNGDGAPDRVQTTAFGGAGRRSELDISTAPNADNKRYRYVRVSDVSADTSHGAASTPGVDIVYIQALSTIGEQNYVNRSCRAYPTEKAESCTYRDLNTGVFQIGWEGYCVERHPTEPDWCLNWLPVDVISGSDNVFVDDDASLTQAPLYYCADTESKPLPVEFWDEDNNNFRQRFICLNDDMAVSATCSYILYKTDNSGTVTREQCFGTEQEASDKGLTYDKSCDTGNPEGTCGNPGTFTCPKNGVEVQTTPLCAQPDGNNIGEGQKCSTVVVAYKPRAAALGLISKEETDELDVDGKEATGNNDAWALGVATPPTKFAETFVKDEDDIGNKNPKVNDCDSVRDTRDDGGFKNYLNRYCKGTLNECIKTLKKYYDQFRIWQWRSDDGNADNCGNDNASRGNNNCTDGWGGSCKYATKETHDDDGEGCGEPDDWNDINTWEGVTDHQDTCDIPDNNYGGNNPGSASFDPQGSNWQLDEDYPLICTSIVKVVDDRGRGKPYASRIQGGLIADTKDAKDVSGQFGYNDSDAKAFRWNYNFSASCTPYGATPFIDSPAEIGKCEGVGISFDENGDPLTICEVDPFTGACQKRDPDVPGGCTVVHSPLELYHPYNPDNNVAQRICGGVDLGNVHFACNRDGINSDAPCRVCDNASANPGRSCAVDTDCDGGKCITVSPGRVCDPDSTNKGSNCSSNSDCPSGRCTTKMCSTDADNPGTACSNDGHCPNGTCVDGYEETGDVAVTGAVRRLQQLFALSQGEWIWNESDGYVLNTSARVRWDPPTEECSGGERLGTGEYCGVKPKVNNILVNETGGGDITVSSSNPRINLSFEALVDADQGPLKNIVINWGDTDNPSGNYEGTVHAKDYSCETTTEPNPSDPSAPPLVHCDICPGDDPGTTSDGIERVNRDGIWKCEYRNYPRVRLYDTWGWCNVSGLACDDWSRFSGTIVVGP